MKPTLDFDIEVYRNYLLIAFMNVDTGNVRFFEKWPKIPDDHPNAFKPDIIRSIMGKYRLVSFNGINYDVPVITKALTGCDNIDLKWLSDHIINNNIRSWQHDFEPIDCDHIDLIEVAPGVMTSLKIYGGRLHAPRLQDLPIHHDELINAEQRDDLRRYCVNDLQTTLLLFQSLQKQIALRERMSDDEGIDLRSKSDAQIAEAVIKTRVEALRGERLPRPTSLAGTTFKYDAPDFIYYETQAMADVLGIVRNATFSVSDKGRVDMPDEIANLSIRIGNSDYRMGIGGLHSSEKCASYAADSDHILIDRDVASYYPAIILNCGLAPEMMGNDFTIIYRQIVEKRLEAKRNGDDVVANSLKITINGSFGKFGSPYSRLYSPKLLIQTTVTGQLALLMLIEMLEEFGVPVVSANTDGIVILCPTDRVHFMDGVIEWWEYVTNFDTEATQYRSIYSRDVNNYIAIKLNGEVKMKGAYAPTGLMKNPVNGVCVDAAVAHLKDGTPIEQTIYDCKDLTKFVTIRQVKGGAVNQQGDYLGKAVRWYYANDVVGPLTYQSNGYTVARSDSAQACMELPSELPTDINFDWYVAEAKSILADVGYVERCS